MFDNFSIVRFIIVAAILWQLLMLIHYYSDELSSSSVLFDDDNTHTQNSTSRFKSQNESRSPVSLEGITAADKTKTLLLSSIRDSCFSSNSDRWLDGTIASNNDAGFTPEMLETLLEGPLHLKKLPSIFDQTICHESSPLRSFTHQMKVNNGINIYKNKIGRAHV